MQQATFTQDGVIYRENGDGNVTVVGHLPSATAQTNVVKMADLKRPYEAPMAQADLAGKQLENVRRQQEIDDFRNNHPAPVSSNPALDALTGPEYLKHLPPAIAAQAQALIDGRMAFPSGAGMRSPYWQQMLSHVAHADPGFDSVNFNARNNTRKDFTSGKSAQNIKALNTAIGHVGQLSDQIDGTASHGGFPFATTVNAIQNSFNRGEGDPGVTKYDQTAGAVASELTQVFRGSGGAEGDVKRYLGDLSSAASAAQKHAAVQNIAGLLQSRLQALGDQYTKGMGTSAQPLQLLDSHAQQVLAGLRPGGDDTNRPPPLTAVPGSNTPPSAPGGGGLTRSTNPNDIANAAPPLVQGAMTLSPNGAGISDPNKFLGIRQDVAALLQHGATKDEIGAYVRSQGADPTQIGGLDDAIQWRDKNPGYKGGYGVDMKQAEQPGSLIRTLGASPVGSALSGFANGIVPGGMDEVAGGISALTGGSYTEGRDAYNAKKNLLADAHPIANLIGTGVGAGLDTGLAGMGLAKMGLPVGTGAFNPTSMGIDFGYGSLFGAGQDNQDRIGGAIGGGIGGVTGGVAGRGMLAPIGGAIARNPTNITIANGVRGMMGRPPVNAASALSPAEGSAVSALNKSGVPDVQSSLTEARGLGVPMTLADTNPNLRSLAEASVRRSPTAASYAETNLGPQSPRALGQYDRLGQAVGRDLGPIGNIPQISSDLTQQARTAAAPLYAQAYSAPGTSSDEIDSLLNTPFGKQGLNRAYTIAANERRDPTAMGFDLNDQGEVTLNRVPSIQTLDYAKRGMDDVLEQQRNPLTGRLSLDESGQAQLGVKNQLLSEMDRLNPAYDQARAAYAGPVQARDALMRGQDARQMQPNAVAMMVGDQSPEHLAQMQLGDRDTMMQSASNVRNNQNPWAQLNTPNAEDHLNAMYPGDNGVPNLMRQRDLELQLANTNSKILGGSRTAANTIADNAFAPDTLASTATDVGTNMLMGRNVAAAGRAVTSSAIRDALNMGLGQRAVAKADDLAPILMNPDPSQNLMTVSDLLARSKAYQDFVNGSRVVPSRLGGMLGSQGGAQMGAYAGS